VGGAGMQLFAADAIGVEAPGDVAAAEPVYAPATSTTPTAPAQRARLETITISSGSVVGLRATRWRLRYATTRSRVPCPDARRLTIDRTAGRVEPLVPFAGMPAGRW
jgi:hypothetical protein